MKFAEAGGLVHTRGGQRRPGGFTLIELIITVAIVAILATIAVPAYTDSVRKGKRGQAKTDLAQVAQMMERCYTAANTYVGCFPGDTLPAALADSPTQGTPAYTMALSLVTRTTYSVTATKTGGQVSDSCGNLSLTHTGAKAVSAGTIADCW
ncbi:MAG: type IV pilin protein [Lysobacterales bacterium]